MTWVFGWKNKRLTLIGGGADGNMRSMTVWMAEMMILSCRFKYLPFSTCSRALQRTAVNDEQIIVSPCIEDVIKLAKLVLVPAGGTFSMYAPRCRGCREGYCRDSDSTASAACYPWTSYAGKL
jgi:hypothetical protein